MPSAAGLGQEAVEPAVAAGKDRLRHAAEHGEGRRRPLAVQNVPARRVVGPDQLAGVLVQGDEARGVGGGNLLVRLVDAVGGADQQQVAGRRDRAAAMLCCTRAQLAASCRRARRCRPRRGGARLGLRRAAFVPSQKPSVSRQTTSPRLVTIQSRLPSTSGAQQMPCSGQSTRAARRELLAGELPEELAVALAESRAGSPGRPSADSASASRRRCWWRRRPCRRRRPGVP